MSSEDKRGITLKELRGDRPQLTAEDFVSQRGACEPGSLWAPTFRVPKDYLSTGWARIAQNALNSCVREVGLFGERDKNFQGAKFRVAAKVFSRATHGVSAQDVIYLGRNRYFAGVKI